MFAIQYVKVFTPNVDIFEGNYAITLAFMSEMPNLESSALQDYEQHALTAVDSGAISKISGTYLCCQVGHCFATFQQCSKKW